MKLLSHFILFFLYLGSCHAQGTFQKLDDTNRQEGEVIGWSTSISKDQAVSGAPHYQIAVNKDTIVNAGAVYVFQRTTTGTWKESQQLTAPYPKANDWFGTAVSINGNHLAVGANGFDQVDDDGEHRIREGAVFMYEKGADGIWKLTQTLTIPSPSQSDNFGKNLMLQNGKLIVSAHMYKRGENPSTSGTVFIYQLTDNGKWIQRDQIQPPEGVKNFGYSISMSDRHVLITAAQSNSAYLYDLDESLKAVFKQKLVSPNSSVRHFASSVCVTDDYLFVGAEGETSYKLFDIDTLPATDSVFVMRIMTETDDGYQMAIELIPNDPSTLESMNITKEKFREEAVRVETWEQHEERKAGAGSVFVYEKDADGMWKVSQEITASDRGADDKFGMCLSAHDSLLIVGAFADALENTDPAEALYHGAAYVFQLTPNGRWKELEKLTSVQERSWLKFGFSVDMENDRAIIGSRFERINDDKVAGGVYIWEKQRFANNH
ncbi:MAG: FG-GAP repeat protein [Flavobacteriales bacterium]|nr:FG-GAP repeat protein [Flavobacteriales bacterium]